MFVYAMALIVITICMDCDELLFSLAKVQQSDVARVKA